MKKKWENTMSEGRQEGKCIRVWTWVASGKAPRRSVSQAGRAGLKPRPAEQHRTPGASAGSLRRPLPLSGLDARARHTGGKPSVRCTEPWPLSPSSEAQPVAPPAAVQGTGRRFRVRRLPQQLPQQLGPSWGQGCSSSIRSFGAAAPGRPDTGWFSQSPRPGVPGGDKRTLQPP